MRYNWFWEDFKPTPEILDVFYKYTMGFISRIMKLWCAVQEDYINAVVKPSVDAGYIEKIGAKTFSDKNIEQLTASIDNNPLFSAKDNAVYSLPAAKQTERPASAAREYSTRTFVDNVLSKTYDPRLAARVYDHVSESLDSRGIPANWNQICTAIANVMKTKSGKNMDKDHLVTAVLDRLDKKSRAKSLESIVDAAKAIKLTPPINP